MTEINKKKAMSAFGEFLDIIDNLRGPKGCPWDREQTPQTLRGHLIEETYEAVEAIDEEDTDHVREELGDVLLLLGMLSQMFSEQNDFDFSDVISEINAKLIRRHPHVFGNEKAENAADVLTHWERVKND
ncbi:MAG: MazG nucleotide pyrophosphohydrolase domain-containing protein, partial [Spirochaetaceae bacterium]|nr:MazG nucleotide pyrophosphohydrolase domain-containing protein [Spirochaetaceae bacterium]